MYMYRHIYLFYIHIHMYIGPVRRADPPHPVGAGAPSPRADKQGRRGSRRVEAAYHLQAPIYIYIYVYIYAYIFPNQSLPL